MRIGLDTRFVYDHFPGIGRYVFNLARALGSLPHQHTLLLLYNPALPNTRYQLAPLSRLPSVQLIATRIQPFSLAEQVQLPSLARSLALDVFHSPYYIKPYFGMPCPTVVTIHDLIGRRYPETLSRQGRYLYNQAMALAVRCSSHIITVSQYSRADLLHYYRLPPDQITVTHEAAEAHFQPQPAHQVAQIRDKYGLPARYVLYLGSNKPHKNLLRLIGAWERVVPALHRQPAAEKVVSRVCTVPPSPAENGHAPVSSRQTEPLLVLAGHYDPRYPEARQMVLERGMERQVRFLPDVAEADLPALYSGAEVFVFPSYYEGFGLPPLEAMACGAPVLCAHASSLPEVVGQAALTFDPHNAPEMATALHQVLSNSALARQLREQSQQQARAFSWNKTAQATLAVYEALGENSLRRQAM